MNKRHYTYVIFRASTSEYYIGVRSCDGEPQDDPYMGSSKTLKRRMKDENDWMKFIIQEYPTRQEAVEDEGRLTKGHLMNGKCLNRNGGGNTWRTTYTPRWYDTDEQKREERKQRAREWCEQYWDDEKRAEQAARAHKQSQKEHVQARRLAAWTDEKRAEQAAQSKKRWEAVRQKEPNAKQLIKLS